MKNYLDYKNKIFGLEEAAETIKASEKIAVSTISFLRQRSRALSAYSLALEKILARLSLFYENKNHPLIKGNQGRGGRVLLVISGERGMVGGLWYALAERAFEERERYKKIVVIGEKGKKHLEDRGIEVQKSFAFSYPLPSEQEIGEAADFVFQDYLKKKALGVDILYPSFISFTITAPKIIQFLPFDFKRGQEGVEEGAAGSLGFPIFEPDKKAIFASLLKKYAAVSLRRVIFEAKLSELTSRAITCEHSFEKAQDLIRKTRLEYYKERRISITKAQQEAILSRRAV